MQRPSGEFYSVTLNRTYVESPQDDNTIETSDGNILWNEAMGVLHKEIDASQSQVQGLERTVANLRSQLARLQTESEKRGDLIEKHGKKLAIAESIHTQLDVEKCKLEVTLCLMSALSAAVIPTSSCCNMYTALYTPT